MKNNGIYQIDARYGRDELAAVYLIVENGKAALVETANVQSLLQVIIKLDELQINKLDVEYIFLTHIHLDHAGGASGYMSYFPNAKLVVHPKGVRHMVDPSKLEASVIAVYGENFMRKMYGKLIPIDKERIIEANDGLVLSLNGREIECRDTPGHANHHNIIIDRKENVIFSGDIFGVSYPEFCVNGRQLVFPTTSPVNFDPEKMFASIELIKNMQPNAVLPTHYNRLTNINLVATELTDMVKKYVSIALELKDVISNRKELIKEKITVNLIQYLRANGVSLTDDEILQISGMDMELNAQGLDVWLNNYK